METVLVIHNSFSPLNIILIKGRDDWCMLMVQIRNAFKMLVGKGNLGRSHTYTYIHVRIILKCILKNRVRIWTDSSG
jgi:hypothetical protein